MSSIILGAIDKNNWIALSLSMAAGLSTAIGGCIVYFKKLVKLANRTFLSAALGFSAGVMLFISFADIFIESKAKFEEAFPNRQYLPMLYASLSLFAGVFTAVFLDWVLHKGSKVDFDMPLGDEAQIEQDLHDLKEEAKKEATKEVLLNPVVDGTVAIDEHEESVEKAVSAQMKTVGIMTAIAIALHNIPEGIVTYIGYIDDPKVGIPLAIGIAVHNIPEGLSVALPVYYATKNRTKAFLWSLLSGLAEPFGAFMCMLILQNYMSDGLIAFFLGFTGGIMTHICVFELFPTGLQLECEKNYTTTAFLVGVGFIMISLILLYTCLLK